MSDSNNSGDFGAFLAGFVIGGLVGAAVALILAPQSGSETREQILQKRDEWRDQAADAEGQASDRTNGYLQDTKNRIQESGQMVQDRMRIVLDDGKDRISNITGRIKPDTESESEDSPEDDASSSS